MVGIIVFAVLAVVWFAWICFLIVDAVVNETKTRRIEEESRR